MAKLEIKLVKSNIGRLEKHRKTISREIKNNLVKISKTATFLLTKFCGTKK